MASQKSSDESLVERDEVFYPKTDVIDAEPHYDNFTTIQNALRQQTNTATYHRSHSIDDQYRAVRAHIEPTSIHHSHSNDQLSTLAGYASNSYVVPINIQSKAADGHIFNLTQIVEDIGYEKNTPFMRSSPIPNTKNVSALLNIVLKVGGAHGPLVDVWRSRINDDYFQRWYLEKYYQRSASVIQYNTEEKTTQNTRARDYQSNVYMNNIVLPTNQMDNERHYENEVQKIYGYDDIDGTTASTVSTHSSSNEMNSSPNQQRSSSITSILKKPNSNNNNNQNSQTKHHVTIVENFTPDESDQSLSSQQILSDNNQGLSDYQQYQGGQSPYQQYENTQSSYQQYENSSSPYQHYENTSSPYQQYETVQSPSQQQYEIIQSPSQQYEDSQSQYSQYENIQSAYQQYQTTPTNSHIDSSSNSNSILSEYQQVLQTHPDLHNDPNPEIIIQPNPEQQITYAQNISLRYLVPPTPPPPGPLIIREIVPPREPTPPPLVVKVQDPSPPTPPPLVLREAPPPPPPHQEATVLTKIVRSTEPPAARCIIVEHSPPLPPKPQSIIIEKWLPYKPAPPREVIFERITNQPAIAEFEPGAIQVNRQRRHSAEFHTESSHLVVPFDIQRQNSVDHLVREHITEQPSGTFDQLVWTTHQQILAMQQRGREQVQASRQWAANQWQQHTNMFLQYPTHLTTPGLVVYHPPVTTTAATYVQEYREQRIHYNPTFVYPYQ